MAGSLKKIIDTLNKPIGSSGKDNPKKIEKNLKTF